MVVVTPSWLQISVCVDKRRIINYIETGMGPVLLASISHYGSAIMGQGRE